MQTRPLGHTGVDVSALCLGTMYFGNREDKKISYTLLDQYVEAGGSFLDTANIYACWIPGGQGGESETLLAKWMKERGNRQQMFIASKVGFEYSDAKRGLTAKQIEEECNKSLKRLEVDTIDLYYAHCDDLNTPLEETMEAFNRLVQAGKVRFLGASNYLAWRLEKAWWTSKTNDWAKFCCIQQRHTYLRPRHGTTFDPQLAANDDLLDMCNREKVTLLAYSVLLKGAYTRANRPVPEQYSGPDTDARLTALNAVAQETGVSANQVVLVWMMQSTPSVLPLVAASSEAQLKENIDALNLTLSTGQLKRLTNAGL